MVYADLTIFKGDFIRNNFKSGTQFSAKKYVANPHSPFSKNKSPNGLSNEQIHP
jgi:hypothetical protein